MYTAYLETGDSRLPTSLIRRLDDSLYHWMLTSRSPKNIYSRPFRKRNGLATRDTPASLIEESPFAITNISANFLNQKRKDFSDSVRDLERKKGQVEGTDRKINLVNPAKKYCKKDDILNEI
jgi:hypothetical protein